MTDAVKAILAGIAILVALVLGVALGSILSDDEAGFAASEMPSAALNREEIELLAGAVACTRVKSDQACPAVSSLRQVGARLWTFRVTLTRETIICFLLDSTQVSLDLVPAAVRGARRTGCT